MEMSIAAMSFSVGQQKVQQDLSTSVMKMAMNQMEDQGAALTDLMDVSRKTMELSVQPNLGANLDILA